MKIWVGLWAFLLVHCSFAQDFNQIIRGTITDKVTGEPLIGAAIQVGEAGIGTVSDQNGEYLLDVPTGRYQVEISFLGYETTRLNEVLVVASKQTVLNIALNYSPKSLDEIVIRSETPITEIGSREITIEQTKRYAATFYDPARLVQSLPAVSGTNDQNNNVSVRGVSPSWNQWYLEGVEIANPNHTTNAGTFSDQPTQNGGGVNILSAQMLSTSNFLYQTYGTQYGNALGGIFDMNLRTGNNQKRESTAQASLIGFDFSTEGPFSPGKGSYLVNYRYSFTGLLAAMGVDFGGEEIKFQDLAFNLNFPTKKGDLKIFGMGGLSSNDFERPIDPDDIEEEKDFYNIKYSGTMAAVGTRYNTRIGSNLNLSKTLIYSLNHASRDQFLDSLEFPVLELVNENTQNIDKLSGNLMLSSKIGNNSDLSFGLSYVMTKASLFTADSLRVGFGNVVKRNVDQTQWLLQPYMNYHQLIGDSWDFDFGARLMYHDLSGDFKILPRISALYWINDNNRLSITGAVFGQTNTTDVQFGFLQNNDNPNEDLPLMYSRNYSFAYTRFSNGLTLDAELFFNEFENIPIAVQNQSPASLEVPIFSIFNSDGDIPAYLLTAEGTASTYGLQASVEKRLEKAWYYLIGGSYYNSSYAAGNGQEYDSRWNGQYNANATFGREFNRAPKKGKKRTLNLNARILYQGGFNENEINDGLSESNSAEIYDYTRPFNFTAPDFFRIDFRASWTVEKENYTRTLSLDIQNASNNANYAFRYFDNFTGQIERKDQLGLIPLLTYRVEF